MVQKYGGSSVADIHKIRRVAERVVATVKDGHQVVVTVSAMGDTTDELLELAKQVAPAPSTRELDMLLTAGERIAMALLSMAIHELGQDAVSLTGSQSGIITNDRHSGARIVEVRPFRIMDELDKGKVVIVAGYQGVSYKREVTTLGRGGTDTTAIALAAALDAQWCEICSDVDGVYTADPRVVPDARRIEELSFEETQELAEAGAKVLNAQAVEFAKAKGIAIYARATSSQKAGQPDLKREGTVVRKFAPPLPGRVVGVTSERNLHLIHCDADGAEKLLEYLDAQGIPGKQLNTVGGHFSLVVKHDAVPDDFVDRLDQKFPDVVVTADTSAVSVIGAGINDTHDNVRQGMNVLRAHNVVLRGVATSSFRITYLIQRDHLEDAVRALHAHFIEEAEQPVP